jgi:hypothetical protein
VGWYGHFNKSEMALFSECTDRYAQKLLDTADIVREAIYRQLSVKGDIMPTGQSAFQERGSNHVLGSQKKE